jgi:hypothetical protein
MYEFGFPNESLTITDTSTDPNNDITQRTWTEPEFKLEDGTPANYTGTLSGSGGSLTFAEEGTYEVSLEVKDYTNLQDSITKQIKIIPPIPVAVITEGGTLKENRKVTLDMRDSLSPRVDPVQTERNIWEITPLEGQSEDSIKIDTDTSTDEQLNVLFKETGKYEVYLKVHNNFSDANPDHTDIGASDTTKVIEITEDKDPIPDFAIEGSSPNFIDNPNSTTVSIQELAYSIDDDIIASSSLVVYRDMDEDGSFEDESIYGTYSDGNSDIAVNFQEGVSGLFKVELTAKEQFGQETIEKFVESSERRTSTASKTFNVNWIPDIQFNLPEWKYTDDTIDITTALRDENIDTLNVEWNIKRADETDTSLMVDDDIDTRTDYTLDNNGGLIRFKDSGYYELNATVTDEIGQSYTFRKEIRIYPLPEAVITDELEFRNIEYTTKENRKYLLDGLSSYANDYYGPEMHSIDHTKDYWEIIPLDGQNANEVIKIVDGTVALENGISSTSKFLAQDNQFDETLLFKEKGDYLLRYKVTNTYGKESPVKEQIITVVEDTKPVVEFDTITPTYRDPDYSNNAKATLYNITATSTDDDVLEKNLNELRYRFDSDNDGDFGEHAWSETIAIDTENDRTELNLIHVGNYQFQFYAKDEFGQETLDQFVTESDRQRNTVTKIIEVDNYKPKVDFSVTPTNKVDVVFTIGEVASNKTDELSNKIENYVKSYLEANNTEYIDTQIETIETSTISSNDANASAIFNDWTRYGYNSNTWSFNSSTGVISRDNNSYWSGFYDPNFDNDKYTFEVELGTSGGDNDDIGVSFGIDGGPNGHLAFLISQQGNVSVGNNYPITRHGHPSGLYLYNGSYIYSKARPSGTVRFTRNAWHDLKAEVNGKNIKIWWEGTKVIDYTHTSNIDGSFGFFTNSQPYGRFRNLTVTSGSTKTLDEALKDTTWRDDSTNFVVNLSDVLLPELDPSSSKYSVVLSRMLSDELYFAELGTSTNRSQALNFISDNDDRGTFLYNSNMDTALQDLAEWIFNVIKAKARPTTKYVLLNEEVNYEIVYQDYENDPQFDYHNWRYNHDYTYFENDLGIASFHDTWLTSSIRSFDKVGKYTTEYVSKDNPVGTDDRFDNYRKESEMMNGPLDIFVHRKPIAQFTMDMTPTTTTVTDYYNRTSIDFSGEGGAYAQWQPSYTLPSGSTATTIQFKTPHAYDDYWYNAGELYIAGYKNGSWQEIKNYNGYAYSSSQISDTIDVSGQGYTAIKAYFRMRDRADSARGNPEDSYFKIGYTKEVENGFTLNLTDTSYDLDHLSRADKGLVDWEWYWKKVGDTTWNEGKLTSGTIDHDYLVKLRVRDMDGESNLGAWSDEEIVLLTSQELPPVAQFSLSTAMLPIESNMTVTDNSYDPNGDNITGWEWKLYKISDTGTESLIRTSYNENVETTLNTDINNNGIGDYKLTLRVRQGSSWSTEAEVSDIYTQRFTVIPVNHEPVAGLNITPDPAKIIENINWGESYSDPDSDNTGFDIEWRLERHEKTTLDTSGTPDNVYTYTGNKPFTGSFESANRPYGAYKVIMYVTDIPPVPPYLATDAMTTVIEDEVYILPDISVSSSVDTPRISNHAIDGDTITLKAETDKHVTRVRFTFLGQTQNLYQGSSTLIGDTRYWEWDVTIPASNTLHGNQTASVRAYNSYGGVGWTYYKNSSNTVYVKPNLQVVGSYTGTAITGEIIQLLASTSTNADSVEVNFLGDTINLSGGPKSWSSSYMIPEDLEESGWYTAEFIARDSYGTVATDQLSIWVEALKLEDFRITDIINHDYSFPLYMESGQLPVDYKTGYYVTFEIDAKGSPNEVKSDIYLNETFREELDLAKTNTAGLITTWEGKFYTDATLSAGNYIKIDTTAYKGAVNYNYNSEQSWDGKSLIINGSALEDGRVNRTN